MKIRDSYDWVVLGEHPGALLSAGLAARLGLSVLVVPFGQAAKLSVSSNGQYLDPEPNFVLGLHGSDGNEALTRSCLNRLGVSESEWDSIEGGEGLLQVVSEGSRVGYGPPKFLMTELKREWGERLSEEMPLISAWERQHRDILRGWSSLPKRLTILSDRKQGKGDAGKDRESKEAVWNPKTVSGDPDFHGALYYGVMGRNWKDNQPSRLLESLAVGTTGARFKGGLTAYRELLLNVARRLGADIATKTDCRKILTDGHRITGVQLAGRSGTIRAGGVAVGARFAEAVTRLQGAKRLGRGESSGLKPVAWRFTLALTLSEEAIPPGVASRVIWFEPGAPELEIEFARQRDFGEENEPGRVVFLRTLLPYVSETIVPAYQRLVSARMMRKFSDLFPFSEFHVVKVFPEFREQERKRGALRLAKSESVAMSSLEDAGTSPFVVSDLKEIPDNLLVYEGKGLGTGTKLEGLFLIGEESYPDLGSLGGTVAALEGISWVAHRAGLSGPFV